MPGLRDVVLAYVRDLRGRLGIHLRRGVVICLAESLATWLPAGKLHSNLCAYLDQPGTCGGGRLIILYPYGGPCRVPKIKKIESLAHDMIY